MLRKLLIFTTCLELNMWSWCSSPKRRFCSVCDWLMHWLIDVWYNAVPICVQGNRLRRLGKDSYNVLQHKYCNATQFTIKHSSYSNATQPESHEWLTKITITFDRQIAHMHTIQYYFTWCGCSLTLFLSPLTCKADYTLCTQHSIVNFAVRAQSKHWITLQISRYFIIIIIYLLRNSEHTYNNNVLSI